MPSVRVFSGAIIGLDAFPIEVEVDSTPGLHFFNIVGLPDKAVEESKDRIASAIRNSGFIAPNQKNRRIIINLAPADIKKEGPAYDLPIAIGYLLNTGQLEFNAKDKVFFGELSLDGSVRRVNGILPAAFMARKEGFKELYVPFQNIGEASIVKGVRIIGVKTLKELSEHLLGKTEIAPAKPFEFDKAVQTANSLDLNPSLIDMAHIKGQEIAKRALLIAASGGHNILMYGPPGSGKSLLAQALSGILPPMNYEEALEVTKIYSICGLINGQDQSLILNRPFRSPHHTTSAVAIIGGGSWPKPGEISLAHRGVLFLDEMPEFPRSVVEALRQPMENGHVVVSRAINTVKFPSRFMLVGAMNPCPCGNFGDEIKPCLCSTQTVSKYQRKLSGPVLDRIDIQINVPRETYDKISSDELGESSAHMRETVAACRALQEKRFAGTDVHSNSEMGPKDIKKQCQMTAGAEVIVRRLVMDNNLSARSYHKILKIGRTIADLANSKTIQESHIAEASSFRIKGEKDSLLGIVS